MQMVIGLMEVLILLSYAGCNCMLCAASVLPLMNERERRCGREYECLSSGSHTHSTHHLCSVHTLPLNLSLDTTKENIVVYPEKISFEYSSFLYLPI